MVGRVRAAKPALSRFAIVWFLSLVLLAIADRHSITFADAETRDVSSVLLGRNPGRIVYVTKGVKSALILAEATVFWCVGAGVVWVACRFFEDRAARPK